MFNSNATKESEEHKVRENIASPLYDILDQAKIRINTIERIDTISKHPMWRNKVKIT